MHFTSPAEAFFVQLPDYDSACKRADKHVGYHGCFAVRLFRPPDTGFYTG